MKALIFLAIVMREPDIELPFGQVAARCGGRPVPSTANCIDAYGQS
jgi:hypothetical protein